MKVKNPKGMGPRPPVSSLSLTQALQGDLNLEDRVHPHFQTDTTQYITLQGMAGMPMNGFCIFPAGAHISYTLNGIRCGI